jgi:hypothetical protein
MDFITFEGYNPEGGIDLIEISQTCERKNDEWTPPAEKIYR